MKTLIFFGSPHKDGNTAFLIKSLCRDLHGEVKQVDAYQTDIVPCRDCGYCKEKTECAIQDQMSVICQDIVESDLIIIASPVYFGELSGPLLSLLSRLQLYFYARFWRKESPIPNGKKGLILLSGGGSGSPLRAVETAKDIFRCINVKDIFPPVISRHTDTLPAWEDQEAIQSLHQILENLG